MADSIILTATALDIAITQLHVKETSHNAGPEVDEYLRRVGLDPGFPWCAAFLYYLFDEAAKRLGMVNPFPRTASTQSLWRHAEPICRDSNPTVGAVYVLQHGPSTGHAGIVESIVDGVITEISGNTNQAGSREGDAVARHIGQPEVVHGGVLLGYLDFNLAAQPPKVVA
jgi:hypothetical protein